MREEEYQRQQEAYRRHQEDIRRDIGRVFDREYLTYRYDEGHRFLGVTASEPIHMSYTMAADFSWSSVGSISPNAFFNPPSMRQTASMPSLNERLTAAIQEADRCAQRGDNLGRIQALNAVSRLRREIIRANSVSI